MVRKKQELNKKSVLESRSADVALKKTNMEPILCLENNVGARWWVSVQIVQEKKCWDERGKQMGHVGYGMRGKQLVC